MMTECEHLKRYFSEDLASDWRNFQKALATYQETRVNDITDGPTWWKKRVENTMGLMDSFVKKAFRENPGRVIEYEIKRADAEDATFNITKTATLSREKSRKFDNDKVLKVGDTLLAKNGVIITAGAREIHGSDDNPIELTVVGFVWSSEDTIVSFEDKVMFGLKIKTKNLVVQKEQIIKMLK